MFICKSYKNGANHPMGWMLFIDNVCITPSGDRFHSRPTALSSGFSCHCKLFNLLWNRRTLEGKSSFKSLLSNGSVVLLSTSWLRSATSAHLPPLQLAMQLHFYFPCITDYDIMSIKKVFGLTTVLKTKIQVRLACRIAFVIYKKIKIKSSEHMSESTVQVF